MADAPFTLKVRMLKAEVMEMFVVCGSLIQQVFRSWGFHVLWGFVVCIGALFNMPRAWRDEAGPTGSVADIMIRPGL